MPEHAWTDAPPVTSQTYVSAVYHVGRRDETKRRPPELLMQHGDFVLSLPVPLVLFVDPEFEKPCWEARRRLGLDSLTRIVARPLETLDLAALVPLLPRFHAIKNADHSGKETAWYLVLMWSKLDLVAEAISLNPFQTQHFAWIDFAIAHVAEAPLTLPEPSDRLALLEMLPVATTESEHRQEFYAWERGRVAGGFLRGHRDALGEFHRLFSGELAAALAWRLRPNEQMIWGRLTARHPHLFEPYYGDYSSILKNWDGPRSDFEQVLANAAFCRQYQLWDKGLRVCLAIEQACAAGRLRLDPEQTARWLDEHFVASWYGGQRSRCPELGQRLEALAATDYFQSQRERLQANLELVRSAPSPA